jgi:DNA-binding GntR family transcriptional regulator
MLPMKKTLAKRAYETLRSKITCGELPPGTHLVNRSLAKELGVSFTPVREAINRLASEGLVEYVRGGGAYVRELDRMELEQLYDIRELLEPFAAAEAAIHITEHELAELDEICDDWHLLTKDLRKNPDKVASREQSDRFGELEERFHLNLIHATRNRWLSKIAEDLFLASQAFTPLRTQAVLMTLWAASQTWGGHVRLVRALRARDREKARSLMLSHIQEGRRYVLGFLKKRRRS